MATAQEIFDLDGEVLSCFRDTDWTVADPELHHELARRVRGRFRCRSPDQSDVVQETLNAAVRNRLLLKSLTPKQRSGWFWVVVTRLTARFNSRHSKAVQMLGLADDSGVHHVPDHRAEEPFASLERSERVALIREEIATLPDAWRMVLTARNAHGDDWTAIAADCQTTEAAARGAWYRAMKSLRERLRNAQRLDELEE